MKNLIALSALLIISSLVSAQIVFEKGFFVTNNGEQTDCQIKNVDWRSNPTKFKYRLSEGDAVLETDINSVMVFEILDVAKYVRSTVRIDTSSEEVDELSYNRAPSYLKKTLFLKVLVEGPASLYFYQDSDLRRYFYNIDNAPLEQLVYKSYITVDSKIKKNYQYRQDLNNNLNCPQSKVDANRIEYKTKSLSTFFIDYNNCVGGQQINYTNKEKRPFFFLALRPRINISSLSIENHAVTSGGNAGKFDGKMSAGIGLEAEFILPFNKDKWSILLEPTFRTYKSNGLYQNRTAEVSYTSVEFPIGVRHYFFLNETDKIFVSGLFFFDFDNDAQIDFQSGARLYIKSEHNLAFGLGVKRKKVSIEARYQLGRDLLALYPFWESSYKNIGIILGYTLVQK